MGSPSEELQDWLIARLKADMAVAALVEQRVYDHPPPMSVRKMPDITIGPSDMIPDDVQCVTGRVEAVQIDYWVRDHGRKLPARIGCDAIKSCLHDVAGDLPTHALRRVRVVRTFALDDPDGITAHGVVQVEAEIEER